MECEKCKKDFPENEIHEHHLHPRFMDNKKGNGMKIYLCEKCHNILHSIIPSILWNFVEKKDDCINSILNFTERWVDGRYFR